MRWVPVGFRAAIATPVVTLSAAFDGLATRHGAVRCGAVGELGAIGRRGTGSGTETGTDHHQPTTNTNKDEEWAEANFPGEWARLLSSACFLRTRSQAAVDGWDALRHRSRGWQVESATLAGR